MSQSPTITDEDTELAVTLDDGAARPRAKTGPGASRLLTVMALTVAGIALLVSTLAVGGVWRFQSVVNNQGQVLDTRSAEQNQHIMALEDQLVAMQAAHQSQREQIERLQSRMTTLDVSDADNAVFAIRRLMIRQERDFRDFLKIAEQGMYSLHMMVPHSRSWWDEFSTDLEEMISLSEARENFLFNMDGTAAR